MGELKISTLLSVVTLLSGLFAILCDHLAVPAGIMFLLFLALFIGFYRWTQKAVKE